MTQLLTTWMNEAEEDRAMMALTNAHAAVEKRARLERMALERMAQAVEKWGLVALLGLPLTDTVLEEVVARRAQVQLGAAPAVVVVQTSIADWGNIRITLQDTAQADIACMEEWGVTLDAPRFKAEFVNFVRNFMVHRQQVVERRQRRLSKIRKLIQLAQHYREREAAYVEMRRQWAERWTRGLWEPWLLWRVRYVPVYGITYSEDGMGGPETIMCLEGPDCITEVLREFPTATVHRVETDGSIVEMEIPSLLDAELCPQETMTIGEALGYHRHYRGHEVVVNVPAIEEREPEPAPTLAPFAEFLIEVDEELAGIVKRMIQDDYEPAVIADMTPEETETILGPYYFD